VAIPEEVIKAGGLREGRREGGGKHSLKNHRLIYYFYSYVYNKNKTISVSPSSLIVIIIVYLCLFPPHSKWRKNVGDWFLIDIS